MKYLLLLCLAGCAESVTAEATSRHHWPPIYGCVDPTAESCATPVPTRTP